MNPGAYLTLILVTHDTSGIAVNLFQIMDAGPSTPVLTLVEREVRLRAWWTLYMADRWSSSSIGLSPQIRDTDIAVDLPMDESLFESLSPDDTELDASWKPGLWAQKIRLVCRFGPIQELNYRDVQGNVSVEEVDSRVASLSQLLEDWERTIPDDMRMNVENLERHASRGHGGAFVALHLGYHHYATLLYFRFLEPAASSSPLAAVYRTRCKFHASSYSKLVKLARQRENCEVIYPTVGHMAVVSSSVLLHTLLSSEGKDIESARDALETNFEAILELRRYWPNTAPMVRSSSPSHAQRPLPPCKTLKLRDSRSIDSSRSRTFACSRPTIGHTSWTGGCYGSSSSIRFRWGRRTLLR